MIWRWLPLVSWCWLRCLGCSWTARSAAASRAPAALCPTRKWHHRGQSWASATAPGPAWCPCRWWTWLLVAAPSARSHLQGNTRRSYEILKLNTDKFKQSDTSQCLLSLSVPVLVCLSAVLLVRPGSSSSSSSFRISLTLFTVLMLPLHSDISFAWTHNKTHVNLKLAQFESVTLHLEDLQVLTYPRWWKGVLVVCVGDEFSPRRISRRTRFLSGEPGWCQLGGSVTDFTEEREREWTCWIKKKRDENKPYHNLTCIKYPSYTCKKKEKKNLKHNHRSEKHPLKQHASLTFMWLFWKWKVAVQHVHIWKSRCKRVINTVSVNELRDEVFRVQLEGLGCGSISTQWGRRMQQAERLPEAAVTALTVALMNESELSVTFTSGRETPA